MLTLEVEPGNPPVEDQREHVGALLDFLESAGTQLPNEPLPNEIRQAMEIFGVFMRVWRLDTQMERQERTNNLDGMNTMGQLADYIPEIRALYQKEKVLPDSRETDAIVLAFTAMMKGHLNSILEILKKRKALKRMLQDPRGGINNQNAEIRLRLELLKVSWPILNAALGVLILYNLSRWGDPQNKATGDELIVLIGLIGALIYKNTWSAKLARDIRQKKELWSRELPVRDALHELNQKIRAVLREHADISAADVLEIQRMVTRAKALSVSEGELKKAKLLCHDFDELARIIGHKELDAVQ